MVKVELQISGESEPWRRVKVVAVPRVGDLIAMDIPENGSKLERFIRIERVIFVANPRDEATRDDVIAQATRLSEDEVAAFMLV